MQRTGTIVLACMALTSCDGESRQASSDMAFAPTAHYRPRLLAQSRAGHPLATRDTARDAVWWGLDMRHAPIDRIRRLIDVDGSHIDEKGVGIGRPPPPPGEGTNIEVQPFGGCSPAFYVRYEIRRTLLCNRDQPDAGHAEKEFASVAADMVRRFDLRAGTLPVTQANGTRVLAVTFARAHGTHRAYSPVLDKVVLTRTRSRILLAVVLRPDGEWETDPRPRSRQGSALDHVFDGI